jgi:hypothetical protein
MILQRVVRACADTGSLSLGEPSVAHLLVVKKEVESERRRAVSKERFRTTFNVCDCQRRWTCQDYRGLANVRYRITIGIRLALIPVRSVFMELIIVSFVLWGLVSLVLGLIWPSS